MVFEELREQSEQDYVFCTCTGEYDECSCPDCYEYRSHKGVILILSGWQLKFGDQWC